MHFRKIVGEKVYLSPRSVEDAVEYTAMLNDYKISKYLAQFTKTITVEGEKEYLAKNFSDCCDMAIIDKETDKLIGSIGFMHIDNIHRTAELGIFIGHEDYLSHGYGSEAIKLFLDYGFNQLNLNNIMLKAISFNKRALKAYEKCGFNVFGTWPNSHYSEGKYYDLVHMYITKEDFNKKK